MKPKIHCICGQTGGCEICNPQTVHYAPTYDASLTSHIVYALDNLTKRERFAMAAMQGIISYGSERDYVIDTVKLAVEFADALIAELDKEVKA